MRAGLCSGGVVVKSKVYRCSSLWAPPPSTLPVSVVFVYMGSLARNKNILKNTLLDQSVNPVYLRESSVYAFTHIIMFLWGFGTRYPNNITKKELIEIVRLLPQLLISAVLDKHWDLVSELLICWDCVGLEKTNIYIKSWDTLLKQRLKNGAVPGPQADIERRSYTPVENKERDRLLNRFSHLYHTTLTTMIAAVLSMNSASEIPRFIPKKKATKISTKSLSNSLFSYQRYCNNELDKVLQGKVWTPSHMALILTSIWIINQTVDTEQDFGGLIEKVKKICTLKKVTKPSHNNALLAYFLSDMFLTAYGVKIEEYNQATEIVIRIPANYSIQEPNLYFAKKIASEMGLCEKPKSYSSNDIYDHLKKRDLQELEDDYSFLIYMSESLLSSGEDLKSTQYDLYDLLNGMVTNKLQRYNLSSALCGIRCLNKFSFAAQFDNIQYIIDQQKTAGSFGYYGPEIQTIIEDQAAGLPDSQNFYSLIPGLLTGFNAVWTLAECLSSRKVFPDLMLDWLNE